MSQTKETNCQKLAKFGECIWYLKPKTKGKGLCRARFPKTKQINAKVKVVCPGVAVKHDLRVSGRRNALGSLLGKRSCAWLSGTTPAFAAVFRSNTNTSPNFRLPITEKTHDPACSKRCVEAFTSLARICRVAQRAQRQMTGYFAGYTAKRQPVGSYELDIARKSFTYLRNKMIGERPPEQWARMTNKILSDLEGRGTMRTAPEDFNLAINAHEHDAKNAEFTRTYRSIDFPGFLFLQREDVERQSQAAKTKVVTRLPPRQKVTTRDHVQDPPTVELYGFRGKHPDVHYLNPWEFVQLIQIIPLKPPTAAEEEHEGAGMTRFTDAGKLFFEEHRHDDPPVFLTPGEHYVVQEELADEGYILYPADKELSTFRHEWVMRRRPRPCVPCPERTPMPKESMSRESRGRLFSV